MFWSIYKSAIKNLKLWCNNIEKHKINEKEKIYEGNNESENLILDDTDQSKIKPVKNNGTHNYFGLGVNYKKLKPITIKI